MGSRRLSTPILTLPLAVGVLVGCSGYGPYYYDVPVALSVGDAETLPETPALVECQRVCGELFGLVACRRTMLPQVYPYVGRVAPCPTSQPSHGHACTDGVACDYPSSGVCAQARAVCRAGVFADAVCVGQSGGIYGVACTIEGPQE